MAIVIGNVVTAVTNNIAKIKTAIGNATTSAAGLMTTAQVTKLNGIATGATKNTIDSALSTTSTNAVRNSVVTANINTLKSDISDEQTARESADSTLAGRATSLETAVDTLNGTGDGSVSKAVSDGIAAIGNATTSAAGLMTTAQVTKLNGIATGATKNTIDSALSTTSTNAVRNSVVTANINTLNSSLAKKIEYKNANYATLYPYQQSSSLSDRVLQLDAYTDDTTGLFYSGYETIQLIFKNTGIVLMGYKNSTWTTIWTISKD